MLLLDPMSVVLIAEWATACGNNPCDEDPDEPSFAARILVADIPGGGDLLELFPGAHVAMVRPFAG